jgi:predicted transcriptional regulator
MGLRMVEPDDTFVDEPAGDWPQLARVWSVMTPAGSLVTVPADLTCAEADARARAAGVRHLLVGDAGAPLGVLCRCDLAEAAPEAHVETVMRSSMFAVAPELTLGEAAVAMARLGIGCLPVAEDGCVLGLITRGDLRRAGAPERLLGAHVCCDCGSVHAVRTGPHGLEYCLDCLEIEELDGD